jgi:hypothetical protein
MPVPAIWTEAAAPVDWDELAPVLVAELSLSELLAEAPVRLALMVRVPVLRFPAAEPTTLLVMLLTTGTRVVFMGMPGSPVE